MGRRKPTPYIIPTAWNGDTLEQMGQLFDKAFLTAVKELAVEETKALHSKHGVAPVIMNLVIGGDDFFRERRAVVRKRYKQLKREEQEKRKRESNHQEISTEFQ